MIIGLLSDTHNHTDAMAAGLAALRKAGAEFFIHCGDIGGQSCIDLLAGIPSAFVWGNTDFERQSLSDYAKNIGVACFDEWGELNLGGKRIAFTHGDNPRLMQRLQRPGGRDYLCHGHTHVPRDLRIGSLRILNPGALYRATRKTVAILDTTADVLTLIGVQVSSAPGG